ncbi:hypothetical protein [Adonisia turfae]
MYQLKKIDTSSSMPLFPSFILSDDDRYIWPQPEAQDRNGLKVITNDQLCLKAEQQEKDFFNNLEYWKHDPKKKVLVHLKAGCEVDLEDFPSKAEYLEWIMHMHGKTWMTVNAFVEFVTALSYLVDRHELSADKETQ